MTIDNVVLGESVVARGRVTFTVFRSADDPMLVAWMRFRESVLTRCSADLRPDRARTAAAHPTRPVESVPGPTLWRLLATNNRELGRGYLLYGGPEAARTHVRRLQARGADLELTIVAGPLNASRGWMVSLDGSPVMTCGRWYTSASTGAAAGAGAVTALLGAIVSEEPDRSVPSGRPDHRVSA